MLPIPASESNALLGSRGPPVCLRPLGRHLHPCRVFRAAPQVLLHRPPTLVCRSEPVRDGRSAMPLGSRLHRAIRLLNDCRMNGPDQATLSTISITLRLPRPWVWQNSTRSPARVTIAPRSELPATMTPRPRWSTWGGSYRSRSGAAIDNCPSGHPQGSITRSACRARRGIRTCRP